MAGQFLLREEFDTNNPIAPRLYGLGITPGKPVIYLTNVQGNRTALLTVLCQGSRFRGDLACSRALRVYYAGFELPEFDANGARQWRFHTGSITSAPNYKQVISVNQAANTFRIDNHGLVTGDPIAFWRRGKDVDLPTISGFGGIGFNTKWLVWKVDNNNIKVLAQTSGVPDENAAFDLTSAGAHLDRLFAYKANTFLFDENQGRPFFFPNLDFTFAGYTYLEILLPEHLSNGEDEPTQLKVMMEGKLVYEISVGAGDALQFNTGVTTAKPNNALISADVLVNDGKIPLNEISGTDFVAWRDRCNGQITWIGGNDSPTIPAAGGFPTLVNMTYDATVGKLTKTAGGTGWGTARAVTGLYEDKDYASAEIRYNGAAFSMSFNSSNLGDGANPTRQGLSCIDGILRYNYGVPGYVITDLVVGDKIKMVYENELFVIYKNGIPMPQVQNTYAQRHTTFYIDFLLYNQNTYVDQILIAPSGTADIPRQIDRFHGGYATNTLTAVSDIFETEMHLAQGCSWAQYDGKLHIATEPDRTPCFTFVHDPANPAVKSNVARVTKKIKDPQKTPNFYGYIYRNEDDIILQKKPHTVNRKERRAELGGRLINAGTVEYSVMTQSQMERTAETIAVLNTDLDIGFTVEAFLDSLPVLKGSFVYLVDPVAGYTSENPALCWVIDRRFSGQEVETIIYELQLIVPDYYSDTRHGAVEIPNSNTGINKYQPPNVVTNLELSETNERLPDGTYVSSISGTFDFGAGVQPYARVLTKALRSKLFDVTYNAGTNTFTIVGDFDMPDDETPLQLFSSVDDLPEGASVDIPYFVVPLTSTTFKLARISSGTPDVFTDNGGGTLSVFDYVGWTDEQINVFPTPSFQGAFEVVPATRALYLVKVQNYSVGDASLPIWRQTYTHLQVIGDTQTPLPPVNMRTEYDGVRLRFLWDKSASTNVRSYIIKDENDVYITEVDANTLSYVQTAQAESVTRRVYAVSFSGILSGTYAQVTFVKPPYVAWANITGVSVNVDNSLTKTAANGWGNAGAILNQAIYTDRSPMRLSLTPDRNDTYQAVGLSYTPNVNGLEDFEFALYYLDNGTLQAYFNNGDEQVFIDTYEAGSEHILIVDPNLDGELSQISIWKVTYPEGVRTETQIYLFNADFARVLPFYLGVALYTNASTSRLNMRLGGNLIPYIGFHPTGIQNDNNANYNPATGDLSEIFMFGGGGCSFLNGLAQYQEGGFSFRIEEGGAIGLSNNDTDISADSMPFYIDFQSGGADSYIRSFGDELVSLGAWDETIKYFIGRENGEIVVRKDGKITYVFTAASDALKNDALVLDVTLYDDANTHIYELLQFNGHIEARDNFGNVPTIDVDLSQTAFVGVNRAEAIPKFSVNDSQVGDILVFDGDAYVNEVLSSLDINSFSGILDASHGGTGANSEAQAFENLSPLTTLGDILARNSFNNVRVAGNTTTTKKFLTQTGNGTQSALPVWNTIVAADLGTGTANSTTFLAGNLTWQTISTGLTVGTTPIASGASNRVLYQNASNVLSESANLTFNGTNLGVGMTGSYPLDVTGQARFSAQIGLENTAPNSNFAIAATKNISANGVQLFNGVLNQNGSGGNFTSRGLDITVKQNASGSNTGALIGALFTVTNVSGASNNAMYGVSGSASVASGASATTLRGLDYTTQVLGSATNTQAINATVQVVGASGAVSGVSAGFKEILQMITSGANLATHRGLSFETFLQQAGTTLTTNQLIYADASTAIGTNKWCFYMLPDMPSYHVGKFGIGNGVTAPAARLHVRDTAEQFRVEYDASNGVGHTVDSNGVYTMDAFGSTPRFQMLDQLRVRSASGIQIRKEYSGTVYTDDATDSSGNRVVDIVGASPRNNWNDKGRFEKELERQAGVSDYYAQVGGILKEFYEDVHVNKNTDTDVYVWFIPADALNQNGDKIEFEFHGEFGINANIKAVRMSVGGNIYFNTDDINDSGAWILRGFLTRETGGAMRFGCSMVTAQHNYPYYVWTDVGIDFTANMEIKLILYADTDDLDNFVRQGFYKYLPVSVAS